MNMCMQTKTSGKCYQCVFLIPSFIFRTFAQNRISSGYNEKFVKENEYAIIL